MFIMSHSQCKSYFAFNHQMFKHIQKHSVKLICLKCFHLSREQLSSDLVHGSKPGCTKLYIISETLCASSRNSKWMSFFFLSPHSSIRVMEEPRSELAGGGLLPGSSPKWKRQTPLQEDRSFSWQGSPGNRL